jgi:purine-binding chemotaxis protein CheW
MSDLLNEIMQDEDTQKDKFLTFVLDSEYFGVDIRFVTEIVGMQKINEIPQSPDYVKGVMNLRGNIIPVIDMRLRFKKEPADYTDRTCIVVIDFKDITAGLIVDRVDEVVNIPGTSIAPPPSFKTGFHARYISGIGKIGEEIRLLIDCDRLFTEEEETELSQIES